MGRTAGALGPAAAMSTAGDPAAVEEGLTTAEEGPAAEGDGPWRTRGL